MSVAGTSNAVPIPATPTEAAMVTASGIASATFRVRSHQVWGVPGMQVTVVPTQVCTDAYEPGMNRGKDLSPSLTVHLSVGVGGA